MKSAPEEAYPAGWNTFGNRGLNILVHPRHALELGFVHAARDGSITWRYGFNVGQPDQDPPIHPLHRDVVGLGRCEAVVRDRNLAYSVMRFHGDGGRMTLTCANRYFDNVVLRCEFEPSLAGRFHLVGCVNDDPAIQAFRLDERGVSIRGKGVQCFVRVPDRASGAHFFDDAGRLEEYLRDGTDREALAEGRWFAYPVGPRDAWISVLLSSRDVRLASNIPKFFGAEGPIIEGNRALFEKYSTTLAVDGAPGLERALLAPIYWNLSWDRKRAAPTLPVAKPFVAMLEKILGAGDGKGEGPLVLTRDVALAAMALAPFDATLAVELLNGLLACQRADGMLPHLVVGGRATNLAAPPVIFLACMKVFLYVQNHRLLRDWFPALDRCFAWFLDHRRGGGDHRMAHGAPARDEHHPGLVGATGAEYESGMDGSPVWEEASFDPRRGVTDLDSVGLTSLLALSASILSRMAELLHRNRERALYADHFVKFRRSLLTSFFDARSGLFRNRRADGGFGARLAPDCLFPLFTGRLGRPFTSGPVALLSDPAKFGNPHPVPSLAKDDPAYDPDGDGWRGRIQPPLNYLVHLGLRTQFRVREAYEVAARSFDLFRREFETDGHVHENLSALTGRGEPMRGRYARSAPMYASGCLMGAMLLEEVFDLGWNLRLNFGCHLIDRRIEFRNIKVGAAFYSVDCSPERTRLERNRAPFLTATPAARLLEFEADHERISFKLLGRGRTAITLHRVGERADLSVRVDGKAAHYLHIPRPSPATFEVAADPDVPRNVLVTIRR